MLQPLFDRVMGRGVFGSTGNQAGHSDYGSRGAGGMHPATIESKSHGPSRRHHKIGVSYMTLGPGSQESILSLDHYKCNQQAAGIMRTRQLTV